MGFTNMTDRLQVRHSDSTDNFVVDFYLSKTQHTIIGLTELLMCESYIHFTKET